MSNKSKFILSMVVLVISIIALVIVTTLAENSIIGESFAVVLMNISVILVLIATFFAVKVDYETGVYKCRNCGHTFKPTFWAYLFGMHTPTIRYLSCPNCEDTTWCKRRTAEKGE